MPSASSSILSYLRIVTAAWRDDPRDDDALLARFAEVRDEAAFATLVWRHGPLVWRTCRHILGETPDAEDSFQATFLSLARKAGRFPVESLAGWLHRTARRAALDAQAGAQRRRSLEQRLRAVKQPEAEGEDADRAELYAALDEELVGLPEQLRVPLVLRYLEGKTLEEVARIVGCSRPVVSKRLVRGEAILRQRLARRGLAVGIGSVAAVLTSSGAISAVPVRLIGSTARAAVAFRDRTLTGGAAEAAGAVLGTLPSSLGTTIMRKSLWIVLACCLGLGGAVLVACRALSARPDKTGEADPAATQVPGEPGSGDRAAARVDCFGDPLPAHALARMGTTRLWQGTRSKALAFSPDGKTLATHIDRTTICLWDAATGKEIRRLTTKAVYRLNKKTGKKVDVTGFIVALGFSPDGRTLVAMDNDRTIYRWEMTTGKFLRKQEYQGPERRNVISLKLAFLPGGQMLGFGNFLKSVEAGREVRGAYIWDVATGKEICQLNRLLKDGEGRRENTAFSPDGKILATATSVNDVEKKTIISLWKVATGKEFRQLIYKDGHIDTVAFSRDGKTLASGNPKEICVWEAATGKKIHLFKFKKVEEEFPCNLLAYSPDGKTLFGGSESVNHLCDVGTGKEIRSFVGENAEVALFSPDSKTLAVGDRTGSIRLWEVTTGKDIGPRKGYRGFIQWVAYSSDGKTLASLGEREQTVRKWEVATGKEIRPLAKHTSFWWGLIAYSPDDKMLVSGDDMLHLWDTATGKEIWKFDEKRSWAPRVAAFSPDSKKLAAYIGVDKTIRLWEVATGKEIYSLPVGVARGTEPASIAFSPDGRLLAAPGKDGTVSLWEVATGQCIGQLGGLKQPAKGFVWFLAFSPDGRMLATSSKDDDKIHLWEMATGKEIWQLNGLKNNQDGYTLAFSPDGRMLATAAQWRNKTDGSFDWKVHVWEAASGKEIGQLAGHRAEVRTLAFSPDGKTLASGSDDPTCLVWDVTSFTGRLKPIPERPLPSQALSKKRLEAVWADLAQDPSQAYAAVRALQAVPTQAIPLLRERVRSVAPVADPKRLQRWIADLDDNSFTVRDKAQREIEKLGEAAVPALRQALKSRPAVGARRRVEDLLAELEPKLVGGSLQRIRELRAVQVLESIGTAEARQVLQAWAKGVAEASLTREAQAALARLAKRSAARP